MRSSQLTSWSQGWPHSCCLTFPVMMGWIPSRTNCTQTRIKPSFPNLVFCQGILSHHPEKSQMRDTVFNNQLLCWKREDKASLIHCIQWSSTLFYSFLLRVGGQHWVLSLQKKQKKSQQNSRYFKLILYNSDNKVTVYRFQILPLTICRQLNTVYLT